jgi:phosphoenolpyruvate synthase/pyruvate phosphate dikinase
MGSTYTLDFGEIGMQDVPRVGGKNASLGQLFRELKPQGVGVLDGFATTADAYWRLLAEQDLKARLEKILSGFNPENLEELAQRGHAARTAVVETTLPDELKQSILEAYRRLAQGKDGLEVYAMCELPSNVVLASEFLKVFDGYSIGSNDLTQLTLGLDRDSGTVARLFDENNPAVKRLIEEAIRAAQRAGKPIGICGQAPSDFPEFAEWLVGLGIDSISLNPDTAIKTALSIARVEAVPTHSAIA